MSAPACSRSCVSGEMDSYIRDGRLLRANGDAVWVSHHVRLLRDADGNPVQIITHLVDITERRMLERELRHMADHDPLTALLNRRGLEAELERHVTHVNRYGARGALLVLDLDHFKAVNDTLGHEAGDRLIVTVANLLRTRLRSSDAVARLGGDEFAILLPDANAEMARHVAEEIVADVQRNAAVDHGQTRRHVTASVGVTMFTQEQINAESVLVDADLAMYDAKEAGRDRVAIHTGGRDDQPRMKARLEWIARIRQALDQGQFTLHAQPILELHSGLTQPMRAAAAHGRRVRRHDPARRLPLHRRALRPDPRARRVGRHTRDRARRARAGCRSARLRRDQRLRQVAGQCADCSRSCGPS